MDLFFRLLLGIMIAGVLALGRASVVLAHEGEVHPGDIATGIPIVVLWVGGGLIVVLLLFFFIGWILSRQDKRRSQEKEKGRNLQRAEERKK